MASTLLAYVPPRLITILITDSISQTLVGTLSKKLLRIKGFSEVKVEKIKDAAKKLAVRSSSSRQ
jgi:hypothetical protein